MVCFSKAAVQTKIRELKIMNLPIPQVGDGGMLIKVDAVSICGSDVHYFRNEPAFPAVLGHEICGTIVEMGKNAADTIHAFYGPLKIGDRICVYPGVTCGKCSDCLTYGNGVYTMCRDTFAYGDFFQYQGEGSLPFTNHIDEYPYLTGGFSEYMYIYPNTYVWKVPDQMPSRIASLLDPLACACRAVELAQRSPGVLEDSLNVNSTVLIMGDGAIGLFAAFYARLLGVRQVLMIGASEYKLNAAKDFSGIDAGINALTTTFEDRQETVWSLTSGKGPDTVINCVGSSATFREGATLMKRMGTMVDIGNAINPSPVEFDIQKDLTFKHGTYIGMMATTPSIFNKAFTLLMQHDKFHFDKIFTGKYTLESLQSALEDANSPEYIKGYVMFD